MKTSDLWDVKKRQFYKSPLEDVKGIDMIKNFPVAESMHLLELGERMKKSYLFKFSLLYLK